MEEVNLLLDGLLSCDWSERLQAEQRFEALLQCK